MKRSSRLQEKEEKSKKIKEEEEIEKARVLLSFPPEFSWFNSRHDFLQRINTECDRRELVQQEEAFHRELPPSLRKTRYKISTFINGKEDDSAMVVFLKLENTPMANHMCSPKILKQVLWNERLVWPTVPGQAAEYYENFWTGYPRDCHLLVSTVDTEEFEGSGPKAEAIRTSSSDKPAGKGVKRDTKTEVEAELKWFYLGLATRTGTSMGMETSTRGSSTRPHYFISTNFIVDRIDKRTMETIDAGMTFEICQRCKINKYGASLCKSGDYC